MQNIEIMNLQDELLTLGIEEQINSDNFFKFCDYMYTPRQDYEYVLQVYGLAAKFPTAAKAMMMPKSLFIGFLAQLDNARIAKDWRICTGRSLNVYEITWGRRYMTIWV